MATAAQKAKAKKDRAAALKAAKSISKKGSKEHLRAIAKVKRLAAVMKEPTQSATDHAGAKDKRDAASKQRSAAITKMKAASGADKEKYRLQALAAASKMRVQGDIMRDVTDREKGQGTSYIGPATAAGRDERGLAEPNKWQQVNQALKDAGTPWSDAAQAAMYDKMFGTGAGTDTGTNTDQTSGGGSQTGGRTGDSRGGDREPSFGLENWWADEQYDYADYINGVQGGSELNQWDPMGSAWTGGPNLIPKGKYGMKQGPSSYLEERGIGHNLAYKPWMPTAWSPSSDVDEPYHGVPGSRWSTYRQMQEDQGLTKGRPKGYINPIYELLYHYGGKKPGVSGKATPQVVPGDWKPQTPPGGPTVYPLSQVPLFTSGRLSGVVPGGGGGGGGGGGDDDGGGGGGGGGGGTPFRGPLLSQYTGMSSATPQGLWRITGEPEKFTIDPIFGGAKKETYRMPISFYGGGEGPVNTHAIRRTAAGGWTPENNQWNIAGVRDQTLPGSLNLANWAGTQGAYTSTPNFQIQSGLNFLGSPDNATVQGTQVPFLAQSQGGTLSSTTPGPLGSGAFANWALPQMHGLIAGEPNGPVVGYNNPIYNVVAPPNDGGNV